MNASCARRERETHTPGDLGGIQRIPEDGDDLVIRTNAGGDDVAAHGDLTTKGKQGIGTIDEQGGVAISQCAIGIWQCVGADDDGSPSQGGGAAVGVNSVEGQTGCTRLEEVATRARDDAENRHFTCGFNRAVTSRSCRGEVDIATKDEIGTSGA